MDSPKQDRAETGSTTDSPADPAAAERATLRRDVEAALREGEYTIALEMAGDAGERYKRDGDRRGLGLALLLMGRCHRGLDDLPASLEKLETCHAIYQALDDPIGSADAMQAKAVSLRMLGRTDEARGCLLQSREIYRNIGDRIAEIHTILGLSLLDKLGGDIAASQTILFESLAYFDNDESIAKLHKPEHAKVLLNIASNYLVLEQPDDCIRFALRGIPLFESTGDGHNLSMAWAIIGGACQQKGEDEVALDHFYTALYLADDVGVQWATAIVLDDIATLLMRLRRFDEAREILHRCLEINSDSRLVYAGNLSSLGQLYGNPANADYDIRQAIQYLEQARRIAEEQDAGMLLTEIHSALADVHERQGDFQQALRSFRAYHIADKRLFNTESDKRIKQLEVVKAQQDAEIARLRLVEVSHALQEAERRRTLSDAEANTDSLTGIPNRRHLEVSLREAIDRSERDRQPLSLALIDVDHFKQINDTLGHAAGDRVLKRIAALLRATGRDGQDIVARYGGEEFILLLPGADTAESAALAERIRERIAAEYWSETAAGLSGVTVSIGMTTYSGGASANDIAPALLAHADENLYAAKQAGRNRVVIRRYFSEYGAVL